MFVVSVKKRQVRLALLIILLLATAVVLAVLSRKTLDASRADARNLGAATAAERIAYLSQFGWSVDEEPVEVREVIIPAEFDDTYLKYNELQKEQGFDLSPYRSKRVKRWTYRVTNYEGYEGSELIHADILVFGGRVIGGDVCSVELNGFMHGFVRPQTSGERSSV